MDRTYETDHGTVTFTRAPIRGLSYVHHDGRAAIIGHADTPDEIRDAAGKDEARAKEIIRRARRMRAIADALDAYSDDLRREGDERRGRKVVDA